MYVLQYMQILNYITPYSPNNQESSNFVITFLNKITLQNIAGNEPIYNYKKLISDLIWGSDGFVPSGLVQWIAIAFLVLVGIFLIRKIFNVDKHYHKKPMKHD